MTPDPAATGPSRSRYSRVQNVPIPPPNPLQGCVMCDCGGPHDFRDCPEPPADDRYDEGDNS